MRPMVRTQIAPHDVRPDDGRLIETEDPTTDRAADARLWIDIYTRLVDFNDELLTRARTRDSGLAVDDYLVSAELSRLRTRLAFWQERHRLLAPVDLDERRGIISASGEAVPLTRRESQLLKFLLANPGRFFDAESLAARAWHDASLASEQVRTYVVRLRRRLKEAGSACVLASERRRGYALIFSDQAESIAGRG